MLRSAVTATNSLELVLFYDQISKQKLQPEGLGEQKALLRLELPPGE